MRRVEFHRYGSAREVLALNEDAPRPAPGPGEVLVRVAASSVNPIDCAIRGGYGRVIFGAMGWADFPIVTGRDVSGTVVAVGEGVTRWREGDEIFAAPQNRGCAEFIALNADYVARKPRNLPHLEAAALPYVALTTWAGLAGHARLDHDTARGARVIVPRGAGGVGSFAIQLLKAWGARVATTASRGNVELVRSLGADAIVERTGNGLEAGLLRDYDVAFDTAGHEFEAPLLAALKVHGGARYVSVVSPRVRLADEHGLAEGSRRAEVFLAARRAEQAAFGREYHWAFFRPDGAALAEVARLVEAGAIRPVIDRVYPMERVAEAHEYCESKRARGKIVIEVGY